MDLELVEKTLLMPGRQPDYRLNRSHRDFLLNLKVTEAAVKSALSHAWKAEEALEEIPIERVDSLVRDKYASVAWNHKFI